MIKILIVEDEKPILELLRLSLSEAGYQCTCASDGRIAADLAENNRYDLALLDIMLPEHDGYELLEYIRPMGIPVIFLTAMASVDDRVRGLLSGAEDYIVKPFAVAELLARVEVVLRRFNKLDTILHFDLFTVDTLTRRVFSGSQEIALTPKEFKIFSLLIRNKGKTLFRDHIFNVVWEADFSGDTRTVDLHLQRLCKKLALGDKLKSIYGEGYRLE